MKKIIPLIILSLYITGCSSDKNIKVFIGYFPETDFIEAEKITLPNIVVPDYLTLYSEFLVVASDMADTLLHFYKIPDLTFEKAQGIRGQGENEFNSFAMFCKSFDNALYIWGHTPYTIKKSRLINGNLIYERKYHLPFSGSFNQMHLIKDSLLIYCAIPSEFSIIKYNLEKEIITGKVEIKQNRNQEAFFDNNRGIIAVNDSVILYAYTYQKKIDIYDLPTLQLKKTLTGPYIVEEIESKMVYTLNKRAYLNIITGKKHFYALFLGSTYQNEDNAVLEVYDYDGTPIKQYKFDILPHRFEVDEKNGYIYGYSNNYEDYLLRYKL